MGGAEDEETGREEAKRDALKKSLLQEDRMTEAKKAFPTRMALQGLRLGSSLPGKGSYLFSSPSTPCPGTCNSESESVHLDVCSVWGSRDLRCVSHGAISFLHLEASPLASAISFLRFIASAAQECHGALGHSLIVFSEHLANNRFI